MLPRHISELWLPSVKFGRHKYIYMFLCTRCTFQIETVEPRPSPSMDKQTASIYIYIYIPMCLTKATAIVSKRFSFQPQNSKKGGLRVYR